MGTGFSTPLLRLTETLLAFGSVDRNVPIHSEEKLGDETIETAPRSCHTSLSQRLGALRTIWFSSLLGPILRWPRPISAVPSVASGPGTRSYRIQGTR